MDWFFFFFFSICHIQVVNGNPFEMVELEKSV